MAGQQTMCGLHVFVDFTNQTFNFDIEKHQSLHCSACLVLWNMAQEQGSTS